ncbi:MAG TPA: ABC transporter permease [Terriglobales bacterium]|nr:ABC transporter permease [Terriglobales bacterium]
MRILFDIFGQTLRTLWAHKLRSFLTMFGIAWGVFSLLLLVGLGEGFRSGNRKQFESLGENVLFLWGGRAPAMNGSFTALRQYYLTWKDYEDVLHEATDVRDAVPVIQRGDLRAVSDYANGSPGITGTLPKFNEIRYFPIDQGRWITEADNAEKRLVIVIGDETKRVLFPGRPAIGNTLLLNGARFLVIGTVQRIGRGDNTNRNMFGIVPFNTMKMLFPPTNVGDTIDPISMMNYQPRRRDLHESAKEQIHRIVGRNHGFDYTNKDSFDEWDTIKTVDTVGKIFDAMNMFLGSVGLVTLALGAIGIINIMLVAVADRTKEIGLRKAVGATNRSIMFQFFVEGAFLTLLSGGLGILCAAGVMAGLTGLFGNNPAAGFDPPKLVPMTAALAVLSLGVAGTVAGLYPARRAALLEPVEALRKE